MVREFDPSLEVVWDGSEGLWFVTCGGTRLFSLEHADGTPVRNLDGHGDELLTTLRRCDMRNRFGEVRKRLRGARRYHAQQGERERDRLRGECSDEARQVAKFIRQGPTPMIGGAVRRSVA